MSREFLAKLLSSVSIVGPLSSLLTLLDCYHLCWHCGTVIMFVGTAGLLSCLLALLDHYHLCQNSEVGGHQFHNNEEVEMAIRELLQRQEHDSSTTGFLNSCQYGTNASV
jgi:hypothetical protein